MSLLRPTVSTARAAEMLGVSAVTVQKWVDAGHLSAHRTVGGHRRIDLVSVQRMVAEHDRQTGVGRAAASPAPRVVIVEDDLLYAITLREEVARWLPACDVRTFGTGVAALLHIGTSVPDLLIADVDLPGMNGIEVVRQMRELPATRQVRALLMSAHEPAQLGHFGAVPQGVVIAAKPLGEPAVRAALDAPIRDRG